MQMVNSRYLDAGDISGETHGRIDSVVSTSQGVVMQVRGVSKAIILDPTMQAHLRRDFAPDDMDQSNWVGRSVRVSRNAYGLIVDGVPKDTRGSFGEHVFGVADVNVRVSRWPGV